MKNKLIFLFIGLILLVSIVAAGALGVLAFSLNTKLTDTQTQLKDLQDKNATLQSTYDALTTENTQTKNDLAQAQEQAKKLEGDLKAADGRSTDLTAKLDKVNQKIDLLYSFWMYDFDGFETGFNAANDDVLTQKYNDWNNAPASSDQSFTAYEALMEYLIQSIGDAAK